MDEYALESFIDFCDNMTIEPVTEGVKEVGKSLWEGVKRIFRKIVNWFMNIIRSINYFKNATLDEQMNRDLVEVLKVSQPKTELNFGWINYYYKIAASIPKNKDSTHVVSNGVFGEVNNIFTGYSTTVEEQIKKSVYDIDSSLKAAEESSAKKRLDANEYKNEKTVTIPLGQITSDLKKSHSGSVKAENELTRIDNASTKLMEFTKGKELVSKAHIFYSKLSQYYKFRIDILSKFLNHAKASLKGTINNVKDKFSDDKMKTKYKPETKIKISFKSKDEVDKIMELNNQAMNAKSYDEYKPIYDEISKKLKHNGPIVIVKRMSETQLLVLLTKEGTSYPIGNNQKLFHHSNSGIDLTVLTPRWTTPAGVLFPTPRIYFHVNVPLDRYAHGLNNNNFGGKVYTPTVNISKVFVDKELSRTACYVETTKPIPVKPVDYSAWQKARDVELGFDKSK